MASSKNTSQKRSSKDKFRVPAVPRARKARKEPEYTEIDIEEPVIIKTEPTQTSSDKVAEKIVGATYTADGRRFFVVKWRNSSSADMIPAEIVKQRWPALLSEFYAERQSWVGIDETVD